MFDDSEPTETPMICALLRQLHTARLLPVDAVGDLLGVEDPYPFLSSRDLKYGRLRTLFRNCSSIAGIDSVGVQRRILANLTDGKGWTHHHVSGSSVAGQSPSLKAVFDLIAEANAGIARLLIKSNRDREPADLQTHVAHAVDSLLQAQQMLSMLTGENK